MVGLCLPLPVDNQEVELRKLVLDLVTVGQVLFVDLRTSKVLISVFDLDLDIVFYREEPNTGKRGKQSTHGIDLMLKQL